MEKFDAEKRNKMLTPKNVAVFSKVISDYKV